MKPLRSAEMLSSVKVFTQVTSGRLTEGTWRMTRRMKSRSCLRLRPSSNRAVSTRLAEAVHDQAQIGPIAKRVGNRLQLVRQEDIVAVEEGDDAPTRLPDAFVPRCVGALVHALPNQPDTRIVECLDHGRPVVS